MEKGQPTQAEWMLEQIFYYMMKLEENRSFPATILLLTDFGSRLVSCDRTSFWYWDRKKHQYWTMAAMHSDKITIPESTGIVGVAMDKGEPIIINCPYEDERFNPQVDKETGYVTKSILCIPVKDVRGDVIGVYQAINKIDDSGKESEFDDEDVKYLKLASVFAGKALESQLLYEQTQIDSLTGLKNRRGFECYYRDVICEKKAGHVSIIMCDIDFFKKVNDQYGHNAGDAVLVHISNILKKAIENRGEVVRWGGEEFILVAEGDTEEVAAERAEEIRKKVEESDCEFEDRVIRVTMSFGVKELDLNTCLQKNIECTDERLYTAKETGRNRVVSGLC